MDLLSGDSILFYDPDSKNPIDEDGCNQLAFYLSEKSIIFSQRNKAVELSLFEFKKMAKKIQTFRFNDKEFNEKVLKYFQLNKKNARLIKIGIQSLDPKNKVIFDNPDLMPNVKKALSTEVHQESWERAFSKIKPLDYIFTFDTRSLISKVIAAVDNGSWSHVGTYLGKGKIYEMISSGSVVRDIEIYKKNSIRLGIYRLIDITEEGRNALSIYYSKRVGRKYNYKGVLRLGLKKIFNKNYIPKIPGDFSPNDMIYTGHFYLVDYV